MHEKAPAFILFGGYTRSLYHYFNPLLRKMGIKILIIDLPGSEQFLNMAGLECDSKEIFYVDSNDIPFMLEQCRLWRKKYDLRGGLNTIEEFTTSSSIVLQYLELKGPGIKACTIASNKALQRAFFEEWSPACRYIKNNCSLPPSINYPAMIKAIDRHGGQGVALVNDHQEALAELTKFGTDESLNLEEYIHGVDFSVESLVRDGFVFFQNLTEEDNLYADGHFIEMGNSIPSRKITPAQIERAYEINAAILKRMDFADGISHAEYRITDEGNIYLIEIAARPPGDGIFSLYQLSTGQFIEEAIIQTVMGNVVNYPSPSRLTQQIYLRHKPGKLEQVRTNNDELEVNYFPESKEHRRDYQFNLSAPAIVREVVIEHPRGAALGKMTGSGSRAGWVIFDAPSSAELDHCADRCRAGIEIVTLD